MDRRGWREWVSASSPREHQPQPAVWTPAPPELLLSGVPEELEEEGGRRRRDCWGGLRPPLRLAAPPPPARAACPQPRAQPAPALSPGAGSCRRGDAQGRDPSPRFAPEPGRAKIKPSAGCGNPGSGSLRSAERRGRSLRLPAPPPLGPGCRSGVPSARAHATARAPRLYLQLSNEESPGESTGAAGDVSCARGCCCRRGCLKLPKLRASERLPPAGSSRERNSEDARVTAKDRTDARTFGRHHRRRPIPRALKAPQFCELCSGLVAC